MNLFRFGTAERPYFRQSAGVTGYLIGLMP